MCRSRESGDGPLCGIHSSFLQPSCTARPPVFHSERRRSARGTAVPCALGDTRLMKWKASADRTRGPPSWLRTYYRSTAISLDALPAEDQAQHAIGIKVWRISGIFRATMFVLSLTVRTRIVGIRKGGSVPSAVLCASTLVCQPPVSRLRRQLSSAPPFLAVPSKPESRSSPGPEHAPPMSLTPASTNSRSALRTSSRLFWSRRCSSRNAGQRLAPSFRPIVTFLLPNDEGGSVRSRTLGLLSITGSAATAGHRTSRRWGTWSLPG